MRYASVEDTTADLPRRRRRFGPLPASKWRLPACDRMTFPEPVILNRLATDFFVLIPFGRLIVQLLNKRARNIEVKGKGSKGFSPVFFALSGNLPITEKSRAGRGELYSSAFPANPPATPPLRGVKTQTPGLTETLRLCSLIRLNGPAPPIP